MKNSNKKGFTLVELLVVIAILAILATVAVVGYTSFQDKAYESNDRSLVAQLNTAITKVDGKYDTFHEVVEALDAQGFEVTEIAATSKTYEILWDMNTQKFFYTADEEKSGAHIWIIADAVHATNSTYYTGSAASVEAKLGFDAGNTAVDVVYTGTGAAIIRTNGGNLTVNSGNVTHYGVGNLLTLAANVTYIEKGTFAADQDDYTNAGEANAEYVYVATYAELVEKLADVNVAKIALSADIAIETALAPDASTNYDFRVTRSVEINLNGHNITSVHNTDAYSFTTAYNNGVFMVESDGVLTLTGAGDITILQNGNMEWSATSAVIATRGDVIIDGAVKLANLGGTAMSYAIDMWAWGSQTVDVTINAGTVHSEGYRAIRLYNSSDVNKTFTVNVNGGVISAANNCALMLHDGDVSKPGNYVLNLAGGTIASNGYTSSGDERTPVAKMSGTESLTYNITGGQLVQNGVDVTSAYTK